MENITYEHVLYKSPVETFHISTEKIPEMWKEWYSVDIIDHDNDKYLRIYLNHSLDYDLIHITLRNLKILINYFFGGYNPIEHATFKCKKCNECFTNAKLLREHWVDFHDTLEM